MQSVPFEPHQAERVLLVDAADDERGMYALALRGAGYDVRESGDGEAGFVESLLFAPDVIVADVNLPRLNGIQLVTRLREDDDTRDLPVIMLTGYDQPVEAIVRAKAAGANAVRIKPCLPHTLLQDIRRVLEDSLRLRMRSAEVKNRSVKLRARAEAILARAISSPQPCPECGGELQPDGVRRESAGRHYYRPCPAGCGWWFYDVRQQKLEKLI